MASFLQTKKVGPEKLWFTQGHVARTGKEAELGLKLVLIGNSGLRKMETRERGETTINRSVYQVIMCSQVG